MRIAHLCLSLEVFDVRETHILSWNLKHFQEAIPLLCHLHSLKAQPVSTVRRGKFVADSWLEGDVNAHFGAR